MPELQAFIGAWRVARDIEDARAGTCARFEGRVTFTPDGAGLTYAEEGVLHLPGQAPMTATRRYLWRDRAEGIAVLFDDGRPFHTIGAGLAPEAAHPCGPDLYEVSYNFTRWPEWQATWRVRGARKDYVMLSHFVRDA